MLMLFPRLGAACCHASETHLAARIASGQRFPRGPSPFKQTSASAGQGMVGQRVHCPSSGTLPCCSLTREKLIHTSAWLETRFSELHPTSRHAQAIFDGREWLLSGCSSIRIIQNTQKRLSRFVVIPDGPSIFAHGADDRGDHHLHPLLRQYELSPPPRSGACPVATHAGEEADGHSCHTPAS